MPPAIHIRPYSPDDAESLTTTVRASLPELMRWLPWCHADYAIVDAERWITFCMQAWASRSEFPMGVFDAASNTVIGGVGINRIDRDLGSGNLGYWIGTAFTGQGIAHAAARHAAAWAFSDLALTQLEIVVLPDNLASRRVADALGAVCTGSFPRQLTTNGPMQDVLVHLLRRDDFRHV